MYREIAGTDERVQAIPGVRDRRVRATKVRLYVVMDSPKFIVSNQYTRVYILTFRPDSDHRSTLFAALASFSDLF